MKFVENMHNPLISVIVPVYKVEPYLDRCVQSIVDQTYSNLEIILVDDGSPDNCPAMCDAWAEKDRRVKVIHKKNGGQSDARNTGLAVCVGAYIAFVDSDDWIHPDYFRLLYITAQKYNAQISACDVKFVHEGDSVNYAPSTVTSKCYTPEQAVATLIEGTVFRAVVWNKLYQRSIIIDERFPVGKNHEDEFFTYRILDKAVRLAYIDAPLYFYFQRPGSIMHMPSIKRLDALEAYLERLNLLKAKYPQLYQEDKASFCVSCISFYSAALRTPVDCMDIYLSKIKNYRKKLKFTFSELLSYPLKKQIYIIGSRYFISFFSKLLNIRNREN